jgi:flagellar hook-length control protein FliK
MPQSIANISLPVSAMPVATTSTSASTNVDGGGHFMDLLGLLLAGRLAALPTGTAESGVATHEGTSDSPDTSDATDLIAMLFGAPLVAQAVVVEPTPVTNAPEGSEILASLAGMSQKQLPAETANLAARTKTTPSLVLSEEVSGDDVLAEPMQTLSAAIARGTMAAIDASVGEDGSPELSAEVTTNTLGGAEQAARLAARDGVNAREATRLVTQMATPFGAQEWRAELADKLSWVVGRQGQTAEILLNPPALGSIEVRLNLNLSGNEAGAQFYSANANVRDAIDAALPRLRELLAGAGINLGQASVNDQTLKQGMFTAENSGQGATDNADSVDMATVSMPLARATSRLPGLVDLYI